MSDKNKSASAYAKHLLNQVESQQGIDKLLTVMAALRDPKGGCPWDKKQTYQTIAPFTLEETYEVIEAIEQNDIPSLKEELGDLLFQVVFYSQIGSEKADFTFDDVTKGICDKLIRRHPHVFQGADIKDEAALNQAWEEAKARERKDKFVNQANSISEDSNLNESRDQQPKPPSILDDIPAALPELKRAIKIQKRVARLGFDWENLEQVWEKVFEEVQEVKDAASNLDPQANSESFANTHKGDDTRGSLMEEEDTSVKQSRLEQALEEEIGDLLFAVVNVARHYQVDSESALRKANQKFIRRFKHLEQSAVRPLKAYSLEELEALWQQVKLAEQQ